MCARKRLARCGLTLVEAVAGIAVLAILLSLGYSTYRGIRLATQAAVAQSNLRQVGAYLELYFRKFGSYPAQSSDLAEELESVGAPSGVLSNPLLDEARPGDTVSALYRAPSLAELDSPNHYLTAMVSENGRTAVILKTGNIVERRDDLSFDPASLPDVLAVLSGTAPPTDEGSAESDPDGPPPNPDGQTIGGEINLNPNNRTDYEFELRKPDGTTITRDTIHSSGSTFEYSGPATRIRFRPKGNGNQNGLTLDGQPYRLYNSSLYTIEIVGPGGAITVHLYNDSPNGKGKAMGKWWLTINATGSQITSN